MNVCLSREISNVVKPTVSKIKYKKVVVCALCEIKNKIYQIRQILLKMKCYNMKKRIKPIQFFPVQVKRHQNVRVQVKKGIRCCKSTGKRWLLYTPKDISSKNSMFVGVVALITRCHNSHKHSQSTFTKEYYKTCPSLYTV